MTPDPSAPTRQPPSAPNRIEQLTGMFYILFSAACFGSMALFAHFAYADGASPGTLMFLRFSIGALLIGAWVLRSGIRLPRGRALAGYAFLGFLYALMAWSFFTALQYASSGLVALLLYTYPLFVAVLAATLGLDRFGRVEAAALAIASLGLLLALGNDTSGSPMGIALGLAAGAIYSIYIVTGSRLGQDTPPLAASFVVLTAGAACHALAGSATGFAFPQHAAGWAGALAIGVFGAALAIGAFFAGLKRVGPTRASVLSTLEPLVTIALGATFLGERLALPQLIGGAAILAAALLLALAPKPAAANP